jgi:sulfide:quinone oxidoreductase
MQKVTDCFYVSPQIDVGSVHLAKKEGFDLIICNRPNNEEHDQVDYEVIEAEAVDQGLEFHFVPVFSGNINLEAIQKTRQLISEKKKTLAYCKTGSRCITMWACVQASCKCPDKILKNVRAAGYDLDYLKEFLIDLKPTS